MGTELGDDMGRVTGKMRIGERIPLGMKMMRENILLYLT